MLCGARFRLLLDGKRFNPNQPRVPRGYRFGGRWVDEDDDYGPPAAGNVILASHEDDIPPKLPQERPSSGRQRHAIARTTAAWLMRSDTRVRLALLVREYAWLPFENARDIIAYFDDPKPLEELRDAASNPKTGYDVHHIVERTSAMLDGFPPRLRTC